MILPRAAWAVVREVPGVGMREIRYLAAILFCLVQYSLHSLCNIATEVKYSILPYIYVKCALRVCVILRVNYVTTQMTYLGNGIRTTHYLQWYSYDTLCTMDYIAWELFTEILILYKSTALRET